MRYIDALPCAVRVTENEWIPMADGVRLAARIWMPEGAPAKPVPAVLEYIPYRKRDLTRRRDSMMQTWLAGHGYAVVRLDMRGSGDSGGVLTDEYILQEQEDGLEALRWIAAQPWCNGRIGMIGISWGGFNGLQIAARQPEALKAVITVCSTDDRYADDVHYMGGCLLGDNLSWASTMFAYNSQPPDPEIVGPDWRRIWRRRLEDSGLWVDTWLRHQRRDAYWKHGSVCEDYAAIRVPVFAVSGWADGYSNAVFRLLKGLQVPCKGLIGPWSHKYPHEGVPGPAIGFLQECRRWWDRWLKDDENGIMNEPRLRVYMQHAAPPTTHYETRPGRWVAEEHWPTEQIRPDIWHLAPQSLRPARRAPEAGTDNEEDTAVAIESPLRTGLYAGKWCSYAAPPDLPSDQRDDDGGALVFDSPILEEPLEILGRPEAELEIEVDEPMAMIAVRLSDVLPSGAITRVTYGLLNLTHRTSHEHPEPLEPGVRYRVRVPLNAVAQRFNAGHRLRLAVSTVYWPLAWTAPGHVRLVVHTDESRLHLPRRPPRPEDEKLRPFDPPETAPPIAQTRLTDPEHAWTVIRDLATGVATLRVVDDSGWERIEEIDLETRSRSVEEYSVTEDDLNSLRGETNWEIWFRRGNWRVRTYTRTLLTSTAADFCVHAALDAYEDERRVYSRTWNNVIPRDHV